MGPLSEHVCRQRACLHAEGEWAVEFGRVTKVNATCSLARGYSNTKCKVLCRLAMVLKNIFERRRSVHKPRALQGS